MSKSTLIPGLLTTRQQQVLNFVKDWTETHGYPPSVREIAAALGLRSVSTVHKHLKALETKGFLRRLYNKPRAIEVLADSPTVNPPSSDQSVVPVPILGRVAAGLPLLAEENREGTFPLPATFLAKGPLFLLQVRGDSMVEASILDGDYVLVRQQPIVENGEIAVVLLENEATVKTFYWTENQITLRPANPLYEPIIVTTAKVLGKVIGVLRFMS